MSSIDDIKVCQYWNPLEPGQCSYWDEENQICLYYDFNSDFDSPPSRYPNCNEIGTDPSCSKYNGNGTEARCILPDPSRHVCNRRTGEKWVIDDITGYNEGNCDGNGKSITCAGYSPQHLGFGIIQPSTDEWIDSVDLSTVIEIGVRLPLNAVIYNLRARLSKCYWWDGDIEEFSIDSTLGKINSINFKCARGDTSQYSQFTNDPDRLPCNGARSDCPYYTGVCWQYCSDDKLESGDKVLAEQIHELRYYFRIESWTLEDYEKVFKRYTELFAWKGEFDDRVGTYRGRLDPIIETDEYDIPVNKVFVSKFDPFTINYLGGKVTTGTEIKGYSRNYPDLVKEINVIFLAPIIRNKFEMYNGIFGEENIFETTSLIEDNCVLIFGSTFYDSQTYGINLSDPELKEFMPAELYEFDSIFEMEYEGKKALSDSKIAEFREKLDNIIFYLLSVAPDKIVANSVGQSSNIFMMDMPTFFGENIIIVLNKGTGDWEFDKVTFNKYFVGGIVGQTYFGIENDGKAVDHLPNYERSFYAHVNDNGEMRFNFFPIHHGGFVPNVDYIYDDYVQQELVDIGASIVNFNVGYKLFKKDLGIFNIGLDDAEYIRILGGSGYILIEVPDSLEVNNAVYEWGVEEIKIVYSDGNVCPLEVYQHSSTNKLPPNQIIVKPTNMDLFKPVCFYSGDIIQLNHVYTYEKRSFGELPSGDYEEVEEYADPENDITQTYIGDIAELSGGSNGSEYSLRKFSTGKVISAVFKSRSGRSLGQTKTKMLTWVKQPYCPDVEIKYVWKANYDEFELSPSGCTCAGPATEVVYGTSGHLRWGHAHTHHIPNCGDHNLHLFKGTGDMWYPYIQCDYFENYNIIDQYTFSVGIMGPFTEIDADGNYIHGRHDLRMLGPADHQAWNCGIPCWFSACPCTVVPCNAHKVGENIFVGRARIRSSVSDYQLAFWAARGEALPKFALDLGKVARPFLRSYRALDHVDYYYFTGGIPAFVRKWKWMPAYMSFSRLDITQRGGMYKLYDSGYGSVLHPFGMFLADTTIDNIFIGESIDFDNRYKFEQVFRAKFSTDLAYPMVGNEYTQYTGENRPWFEFLPYPEDTLQTIHWAWREEWDPLERSVKTSLKELLSYQEENLMIKGPFTNSDDYGVYGKFLFLDIQYPDYKYDKYLREFQLVCDEGNIESPHVIKLIAPEKDDYGEYVGYPKIQLNNGKERCFDWDGSWDPDDGSEEDCNKELYQTCTEDPWVTNVTVFDTGYDDVSIEVAEDEDRVILTDDDFGDSVYTYFQRGLNVTIDPSKFSYFPLLREKADQYNIKYNRVGSFEIYPNETEGLVGQWLSSSESKLFNQEKISEGYVTYSGVGEDVEITYYFDEKIRRIGKIKMSCVCGSKKIPATKIIPEKTVLFHFPQISIYKASNGGKVIGDLLHQSDGMLLSATDGDITIVEEEYEWDNTVDDMKDGFDSMIIKLRVLPTESEKSFYNLTSVYSNYIHAITIDSIELYDETLINALEYIIPHERRYYVSYGSYGDHSPQGDASHSLLKFLTGEYSTVWQKDSEYGVVGLENSSGELDFMNKCRGRFVYDIIDDMTQLPNTGNISKAEQEQQRLHNIAAFNKGNTAFFMKTCTPPGLKEYFDNNNMSNPFDAWSGIRVINDLVFPLATINAFPPYSPGGHSWIPSDPYLNWVCGPETFDYDYLNHDTGSAGAWSANAHWTFYWGTYWIMQRREIAEFIYKQNSAKGYGASTYTAFADDLTTLVGFAS